jgi:hypothetical protein
MAGLVRVIFGSPEGVEFQALAEREWACKSAGAATLAVVAGLDRL